MLNEALGGVSLKSIHEPSQLNPLPREPWAELGTASGVPAQHRPVPAAAASHADPAATTCHRNRLLFHYHAHQREPEVLGLKGER